MAGRSRRDVERRSAHVRTVAARGCAVAIMRQHAAGVLRSARSPGRLRRLSRLRPVLLRRGWLT
ncbi:hypothetical protein AVW13_02285 [Brevibacterium casei]|uniref:Uncharacterized protein n=1 Tax=Brevibacterium casei TaxID=33889 RepID=A0AB34XRE9_9MICO|nr:hypothetical protein AVW13_02285 [Brevibacterium casei]